MKTASKIDKLIEKGVRIPNPQSVEIGDEVSVDRIAGQSVTIFSGSRIRGQDTFISKGVKIGQEGPATIENCYLGPDVALKGGYFQESVFLEGAHCGLGAHVRQGTILEEQAGIAHTVGLKQTILFPYVTLGSLINFCDCLMAGGTSRQNHSEVGSSYIHFNYTPYQDKATPSLIGDVPRGVMLKQPPVFLGGQGGLVGPCRIAFGTVVAAGTICRKDQLQENHMVIENRLPTASIAIKSNAYRNLKHILRNNFIYIGNLYALRQWYLHVRSRFVGEHFAPLLLEGLLATLGKGIDERIKQLGRLAEKVESSPKKSGTPEETFGANWDRIVTKLNLLMEYGGRPELQDRFSTIIDEKIQTGGKHYLKIVQSLDDHQSDLGVRWLRSVVDHLISQLPV